MRNHVGTEEAAAIFGSPNYYLPFLVRAGHLKPLGKPAQNARKWFATIEIERMSQDPDWLDRAVRIVEKQIQEMNKKQRKLSWLSIVGSHLTLKRNIYVLFHSLIIINIAFHHLLPLTYWSSRSWGTQRRDLHVAGQLSAARHQPVRLSERFVYPFARRQNYSDQAVHASDVGPGQNWSQPARRAKLA